MPDEDPYQPFCDPDNLATVVRKTDCEVHRGVAADDYSTDDWFHDPDLSAVSGVPPKYWKNDSDCIVEMTAAEKAAVDAPTFLFKAPSKVVAESISVTRILRGKTSGAQQPRLQLSFPISLRLGDASLPR